MSDSFLGIFFNIDELGGAYGLAACLADLNQKEEASRYLQLALQVNSEHPLALRVQETLTGNQGRR